MARKSTLRSMITDIPHKRPTKQLKLAGYRWYQPKHFGLPDLRAVLYKTPMKITPKNTITLDAETFYAKDYTLSKMSTSEYIRDERFHIHCLGIKHGAARTRVWRGADVAKVLADIDWTTKVLVCHHTQFDGFILAHHFDIVPAFYACTLSMSRGLHGNTVKHGLGDIAPMLGGKGKQLGAALVKTKDKLVLTPSELKQLALYCADDVDDTYTIFMRMLQDFPQEELRQIDCTVRMFTQPVLRVDIPRVTAELQREMGRKMSAVENCPVSVECLASNQQFAAALQAEGVQVPMKISPTTGKIAPALAQGDLAFQALERHSNPRVRAMYKARIAVKSTIGETRALRFLEAGKEGMRLPVYLNYCGAHTHRWSGGNKCLAGDTQITVHRKGRQRNIMLYKLLPDDLVWDGQAFVAHDGLLDQGYADTITYEGITATPDHKVYVPNEREPISLAEAAARKLSLAIGHPPGRMESLAEELPDIERSMHEP